MRHQFLEFHKKYERWIPIGCFAFGFVFDMVLMDRIDEFKVIVQQALYIVISGLLIGVELFETQKQLTPPRWFAKLWKYREGVLHFFLGTLLNSYTIFYFKSASSITSFLFIVILLGLLVLNEFKRFGKSQTQVHMALWNLCLISYSASLAPILIGSIGSYPFVIGMVGASFVFYGFYYITRNFLTADVRRSHLTYPFAAIMGTFVLLYFFHAIPPVPLSVRYLGIFHYVTKKENVYELSSTRPRWKFWQHGDQTFLARPGDSLFCFARVFSPTKFSEKLHVLWSFYDETRGWIASDSVPMPVTGGRDEGFRGFTKKSNFQPGKWQVKIETADNREVGRIGFEVINDQEAKLREVEVEFQ